MIAQLIYVLPQLTLFLVIKSLLIMFPSESTYIKTFLVTLPIIFLKYTFINISIINTIINYNN